MLREPRGEENGVGLVITPNVDHVVRLRGNRDFARAYASAEITVCDGAPLRLYARLRGHRARRVTGCDIAAAVMAQCDSGQRLFFVVDSEATASAVRDWARRRALATQVACHVPPYGFETDHAASRELADAVRAHGTTILLMGVGAPRSEVFADTWRDHLPPCWVLCVGQAVKVALGLVRRAPAPFRHLHAEFLWRMAQEPRRLARRYALGALLFPLAILQDVAGVFPLPGKSAS
jgi:N-acetylglucosaminyldiphosphoundecaprenol N-acetyl-beta-D-mannosaminyltransferase